MLFLLHHVKYESGRNSVLESQPWRKHNKYAVNGYQTELLFKADYLAI